MKKNIYSLLLVVFAALQGFSQEEPPYELTVTVNSEEYGRASATELECTPDCKSTLTASSNSGYAFVQWNDKITENPREVVVTESVTYTAEFAVLTHIPAKVAKCETEGNNEYWYCEENDTYYSDSYGITPTTIEEQTIPALNHNYALSEWQWAEDKKTAKVKFVCENDENHVELIDAVVTIDTTLATCMADGKIVYTANAEFEEQQYSDTKEVKLPAIGHDYALNEWQWAENKESAKVKFVCENDENHVELIDAVVTIDTTLATCTADGKIVYTANAEFEEQNYSDTKEVPLPAIGHDYALNEWQWAENKEAAKVKFVCENDENHVELIDAVVTTDTTFATCTADGKIVYTANVEFEGQKYSDTKEVTLPAVGHNYALNEWQWAEDKESAKVKFVCENNAEHVELIDAVVTIDTTFATCTADGKVVYTANAEFEEQNYSDTKEVTLPAIGHNYSLNEWQWAEDKESAKVKFVCENNAEHIELIDAVVTTDTTFATCTADGKIVYTASAEFEGVEYTDETEKTLPAIGHNYALNEWQWAEDKESAKVKFVCENDENHVELIDAVVTTDTTLATCTADGKIIYTANAEFEGQNYLDTKEVTLPAIGHDYALNEWQWAEDKKTAKVKFVCENDENHVELIDAVVTTDTTSATCTADGKIVYTANAEFEGQNYSDTKEVTLPAIGHNYALNEWQWAEDKKTAKVKFVCENDENHVELIDAVVTIDTTFATCTADGKIVYTANAEFEGQKYSDTKEVTLPAIGHNYALSEWQWAEDKESAKVKFVCENNAEHVELIDAVVTSDTTIATCTADGKIVYTASAEFEGVEYTDETEKTLPAIGHNYALNEWQWAENKESAKVKFVCENDENHVELIDAVVTTDTTFATCTADGKIVYTANAEFEEQNYSDTKEVPLPAIGHKYALNEWQWAEDKESAKVKFVCQNDANHEETVEAIVTTDTTLATCTADGKIVYTANAEFEDVEYTDETEKTLPAIGHNYTLNEWQWTEVKESAKVKFVCENDENHVELIDAVVTTDTTFATCTADGKVVYTANAEFEEQNYSDTKEVTLSAIGHKYALNEWQWAENKEAAKVKFVCENDENHVELIDAVVTTDTTFATCTADGKIVYTANAEFEEQNYSDTKEVTLPAIGHDYALNEWQWAEDKESAKVKFVCENDEKHVELIDAVVTIDTTFATCTADGKIVYTASAEFEEQNYSDIKEVTLPAIGHNYALNEWQWAENKESAKLKLVCENDENHVELIDAVVTTDTTLATCTADGKIVYTANAEFEGEKYSSTSDVILEMLGHQYVSQGWEWRDDWSGAKMYFVCERDNNHVDSVDVETVIDTITNAGIANPMVLFMVETDFDGKTYSDMKSKTLPAKFSVSYNESGKDSDGDGISDEFLGAYTKELYGSTEYYWDRFWSPTTGDFFVMTMTGVANYTGTLQFELVDTLRKVSLGEKSSLIQVVAGEEFTAKVPMSVMVMRDSLGNKLKYTVLEFICNPSETSSSSSFTNNACEFEFSDFEIVYESAGTYDNPHSLVLVGQNKYEYVYQGVFSTKLPAPTKCNVLNLSITVIPDIPLDYFAFSLVDEETSQSIVGEQYIKLDNSTMYVPWKEYSYEISVPIDSALTSSPKLLFYTESPYERQRAIYYIKSLNLSFSENHTEEIIPELAPTCEEAGHSDGLRCSVCGEILKEPTEIPALGHAYVSQGWKWSEDYSAASIDFVCANDASHIRTEEAQITPKTVPATCTAEGAIIRVATITLNQALYQDTKVTVLEKTPHTEMTVDGVQPTCTETGLSDGVQCAVCGAVLVEQTELPAHGHSLQHESYIAPTEEEDGLMEHWYCTVCQAIFDSEAAEHEISNADVIIPKLDPTDIPSQLNLVNVYPQQKHIVVEQAEGELLRIFDVNGHCVVSERISTQFASYSISVAGVYVVAVGATVVSVVVQ